MIIALISGHRLSVTKRNKATLYSSRDVMTVIFGVSLNTIFTRTKPLCNIDSGNMIHLVRFKLGTHFN